jgi:uncharacterized protein (DUF488 family)
VASRIYTVGHSTRSLDELAAILRTHGIERLVDVRSFPRSRRHPHMNRDNLEEALPALGIAYAWLGEALGGFRKARADSRHTALRNDSFRGYADYMETDAFRAGLDQLIELARKERVATMCAEQLWWRCHRSMISDALSALRGVEVLHLMSTDKPAPHKLHGVARVAERELVYDVEESQPH